ncbi:MAG TPA: hypothetical protein VL201_00510 [Patescibacteria group bacterium]|jgi:hypothetical protein|nr:hypothetical protein [Patescibacteria group bacterium]
MFNGINTTVLFLATFFNSHNELTFFRKNFLEKILPKKTFSFINHYKKTCSQNAALSKTHLLINQKIIKRLYNNQIGRLEKMPIDILDIIFSYVLENILYEKDPAYENIFYVNHSFQKKVINYVHTKRIFPGIYNQLQLNSTEDCLSFNTLFPLYIVWYCPNTIKRLHPNNSAEKFKSWPPQCIQNLDKYESLVDKANYLLEATETSRESYRRPPSNDEEAITRISYIFEYFCTPPINNTYTRIEYITMIYKAISSYLTFYTISKNPILRPVLIKQLFYRSCTCTLLGIQLLMLIKKLEKSTADESINNLFESTRNSHVTWLCAQFKIGANNILINDIQKICTEKHNVDYLTSLITEALNNYLINGFLDLNDNTINIAFFIEHITKPPYSGKIISSYEGLFLDHYTLDSTLLNTLMKEPFYFLKEIIVNSIDTTILTQNVIIEENRLILEKLQSKNPLKIIVQNTPQGDFFIQKNEFYHVIFMQSIAERKESLLSVNVTPELKGLIESIEPENTSLKNIIYIEKNIFTLNKLFLKKIRLFDGQDVLTSDVLTSKEVDSFDALINKDIIHVLTFFSEKNDLLDEWYKEFYKHEEELSKNESTLSNTIKNYKNIIIKNSYQFHDHDRDNKIANLISKNNLIYIQELFFLLKQKYGKYQEECQSIKDFYIRWSLQKIPDRDGNKYGVGCTKNFNELVKQITTIIRYKFDTLTEIHAIVFDTKIMNEIDKKISKSECFLKDFQESIELYKNIEKSLPELYITWAISKGFFDKDYTGPREHFSRWPLWGGIRRDIKMSMLDIIKKTHAENSSYKKIDNHFYHQIDGSDYNLSKNLDIYNKWQRKICSV